MTTAEAPPRPPRIPLIDVARGVALVAMAVYHFTWDLEFFGYAPAGMTAVGGWKLFARSIASSFLLLVGVSLWLAHGRGIRWSGFGRRLAMIAGAALAISAVTWVAVPGGFIFFGILHQIAFASVAGLLFLRLPPPVILAVAGVTIALPWFARSSVFDSPLAWWIGLSEALPRSNDYVPVFPWFGAALIGLALARAADAGGLLHRLAAVRPAGWTRPLAFIGRYSLAFYLIHQPVLIGLVWLASQVAPPAQETQQVRFLQACQAQCEAQRDTDFCARYCPCMLDGIEARDGLDELFSGAATAPGWVGELAAQCTIGTEQSPKR